MLGVCLDMFGHISWTSHPSCSVVYQLNDNNMTQGPEALSGVPQNAQEQPLMEAV